MSETIPAWLNAPPSGSMATPPPETRLQQLPFNDLSWVDFERLVLRLARRQGNVADCVLYGKHGQTQEGLDILAVNADLSEITSYQCKNVVRFGANDIRNAVDKFLVGKWASKTTSFVLCVSIPLETKQQQDEIFNQRKKLTSRGIILTIWDGSSGGVLSDNLKSLPELVDDFFGRPWVKLFNGKEAAADLGERLDGVELGQLRSRLYSLYTVVFNQHDPGLRISGLKTRRYVDRYVPIDVIEQTSVHPSLQAESRDKEEVPHGQKTFALDGEALEPTKLSLEQRTYVSRRPAFEWLSGKKECVVLGQPGSGKSALLRFLALSLLNADIGGVHALDPGLLCRLPVWMSFARFAAIIRDRPSANVHDYVRDWLHQHSFDDIYPVFKRALGHSKVLLLVDGLDEGYPDPHRKEALDRIIAFVQSSGSAVTCTSRPRGFGSIGIPDDWSTSVIAPMDDDQVQELAGRWFSVVDIDDRADSTDDVSEKQAKDRGQMFLRAAKEHRRTSDLVRNPLLCQAMIELYRLSHRLPEARVGIYDKIIDLLLSQHPAARAHAAYTVTPAKSLGMQEGELREMLIRIADWFQNNIATDLPNGSQCRSICQAFLEDETYGLGLPKPKARRLAKDIVEQLIAQYGLLVERSPDDVAFVHLSIQEYLVAESVTRMDEVDQLDWLERVWLQPKWRECVTNWFGILGGRGNKGLTGKAARCLSESGDAGEWQRLQSIELRTELACSDLGIPISESRKAIGEATRSVETSPFPSHKKALAHYITVGAGDSGVREECTAALRRWVPGRPSYSRASLLESLKSWKVADDLRETLLRGLHEEHVHCRLAALSSLVEVFGAWPRLGETLYELAVRDPRPEIRAVGLRGLGQSAEWEDLALTASSANLRTSSAELLLTACEVRVRLGRHDEDDLQRMWRLWSARTIPYWQGQVFVDVLCSGWPTHTGVREAFTNALQHDVSPVDCEVPLQYLVRCYPYDDEIASLVAGLFDQFGSHVATDMNSTWTALIQNYRGDEKVAAAVRRALRVRKEEFEAIYWHPQTTPGLIVMGDNAARDELLEAYLTIEPDMGRYWIARTLQDGWHDDEDVAASMKKWCSLGADTGAPLASWASKLYSDAAATA